MAGVLFLISVIVALAVIGAFVGPWYSVYSARMQGEAILAKSESSKKVLIEQARAEKEAATLRAEAIQIVGKAAKDFPEYRQQEFIGAFGEAMKEGNIDQIIYVPTEANIPIIRGRTLNER